MNRRFLFALVLSSLAGAAAAIAAQQPTFRGTADTVRVFTTVTDRDGRLVTIRTIGGSQRVLLESLNEHGVSTQLLSSPIQSSFAVRPIAGN